LSGNEKHISDGSYQKYHFTLSADGPNSSMDSGDKRSLSNDKATEARSGRLSDLNAPVLAMECVFNMNINKQHHVAVEWYKSELRTAHVFDQILEVLKATLELVRESRDNKKYFYIKKYLRYCNFLEYITQSSSSALASFTAIENGVKVNKNLKAIMPNEGDVGLEDLTAVAKVNQNHLVTYQDSLLISLIKE
jgi:hypothetical protein